MGTPAPAGSSLRHPSSHCLLVCAPQLLWAPFYVPQAPTGLLGHPLLHLHCPVCSCSGLRGDSWAVVKGRDGKRGEEAQAHPWIRHGGCGVGSVCSRDGSRQRGLCFSLPLLHSCSLERRCCQSPTTNPILLPSLLGVTMKALFSTSRPLQ